MKLAQLTLGALQLFVTFAVSSLLLFDGRLLVNSLPADNSSTLTLVNNWTAELKH